MISRIRLFRSVPVLAATFAMLWSVGCGPQEPATDGQEQPAEEATEGAEEAAADERPEVFFANIEDGGTYTSPLDVVFEADNFDVVPVEDPMAVRPGEGHYHLAVDVPCAPAGEIIEQGNPSYIHFGDGGDRITLQLEPGQHSLCLQMADGEHRVLAGEQNELLTKEVTITIEEGAAEAE